MGLFRKGPRADAEPLPTNTEFSVVSGDVVLSSGEVTAFSTIVPTVFGGGGSLFGADDYGAGSAIVADAETVDFALSIARDRDTRCRWNSERDVAIRAATPDETAWALANGINERFM